LRWVNYQNDFESVYLKARTCVFVDSGREPTTLQRLIFDDATLCTTGFALLLQMLMEMSHDVVAYYVVLEPDPIQYFHRLFKKYPLVEIAYGDSPQEYLTLLNEDPGASSADAIGINSRESAIVVA